MPTESAFSFLEPYYVTNDKQEATALVSQVKRCIITCERPPHCTFVFENSADFQLILANYKGKALRIEPHLYEAARVQLAKQMEIEVARRKAEQEAVAREYAIQRALSIGKGTFDPKSEMEVQKKTRAAYELSKQGFDPSKPLL